MSEEKNILIRYFKRTKCTECGEEAYYMPTHGSVICLKCKKIPKISPDIMDPMAYMSKEAMKELDTRNKNKLSLVYSSPEDYPLKDFPLRNDKCMCGSGLKFKKCCLPRFEGVRNEEAQKLFESRRDASIISAANAVRLVNMVRTYFSENEGEDQVPTTEVGFFPFINMQGDLKEVDILSSASAGMHEEVTTQSEALEPLTPGDMAFAVSGGSI